MKKNAVLMLIGALIGMSITPGAKAAYNALTAVPSTQAFVVNGEAVQLEAYAINGNNYVKLRDVGKALDFCVEYDAKTNTVLVNDSLGYSSEPQILAVDDGTVKLPTDGSKYKPKVGDVLKATNDGTLYEVKDVSRWDGNMFAKGPIGNLPTPTCDWSLYPMAKLPAVEVRHFDLGKTGDYLFVRNLYETLRMEYTLVNALGAREDYWTKDGPVLRKDGTQFMRINLSIPDSEEGFAFWPYTDEKLLNLFNGCPAGEYNIEAWDVYKNGVFQKTEYNILKKG